MANYGFKYNTKAYLAHQRKCSFICRICHRYLSAKLYNPILDMCNICDKETTDRLIPPEPDVIDYENLEQLLGNI